MAFRKHTVLAFALLVLAAIALGCADDTTAPNTQDEAPVLAPTNVQAIALSGGDIRVSWDPSSQPNVTGYNVYRREVGQGNPNRINGSRVRETRYIDETAQIEREYEYRVTAVSSKGKESRYTAVSIRNRVQQDSKDEVPITE